MFLGKGYLDRDAINSRRTVFSLSRYLQMSARCTGWPTKKLNLLPILVYLPGMGIDISIAVWLQGIILNFTISAKSTWRSLAMGKVRGCKKPANRHRRGRFDG
jgi:hypothetical protein